jgi:hypothetical protein
LAAPRQGSPAIRGVEQQDAVDFQKHTIDEIDRLFLVSLPVVGPANETTRSDLFE